MTFAEPFQKKRVVTGYGVCAVVIILAFLLTIGSMGLRNSAFDRRTRIYVLVTNIQTAILAYQTEYGIPPEAASNFRLVKVLTGDNPRKIEFLSLKPSQLNPDGEIIDPWGTPFQIRAGADGKVHMKSAGPDKTFGTGDDIGDK